MRLFKRKTVQERFLDALADVIRRDLRVDADAVRGKDVVATSVTWKDGDVQVVMRLGPGAKTAAVRESDAALVGALGEGLVEEMRS